jgi:hypothetical protein
MEKRKASFENASELFVKFYDFMKLSKPVFILRNLFDDIIFCNREHSLRVIFKSILLGLILFLNSEIFGQTLKWSENFGATTPSGWVSESKSSTTSWVFNNTSSPCSGSYQCRITADSGNDDFIISKNYSLSANKLYYVVLSIKRTATFDVYIGKSQKADSLIISGTNLLSNTSDPSNCTDVTTNSYFISEAGDYYFGFRVRANQYSAAIIDNIRIYEIDPTTITWDGSEGTDWATAGNWDLNRVPSASDIIVVPEGASNYPTTIPSGSYNNINVYNDGDATITIGSGTAFILSSNLTIASEGSPVVVANNISVGGNFSLGMTGAAAIYDIDADITVSGNFSMGNAGLANEFNINGKISAAGTFSLAESHSQSINIGFISPETPAIEASNSASGFDFYGDVTYNGNGSQIIIKDTYHDKLIIDGSGAKYINGELTLKDDVQILQGVVYPSDLSGILVSESALTDVNLSPFRGLSQSQRWQTILLAADIDEMVTGDFLKSISFRVSSKDSKIGFRNFKISIQNTTDTKFIQNGGGGGFFFKTKPSLDVFVRDSVVTTSGWNHFEFDEYLMWDGDNVLIEISWYNPVDKPGGSDNVYIGEFGGSGADIQVRATDNSGDCRNIAEGNNSNYKAQMLLNYLGSKYDLNVEKSWFNESGEYRHLLNTVNFNGSSSLQEIESNGSPFYNVVFSNENGFRVLDDCLVENTLTLSEGLLNTESFTIELGGSVDNLGTLSRTNGHINGNFKRWFANATVNDVLFPLGSSNSYQAAFLSFTGAPTTGGSLTGKYYVGNPGTNGKNLATEPILDEVDEEEITLTSVTTDGYWSLNADDGLVGGTYSIEFLAQGVTGVSDYSKLHLVKRNNSTSDWTALGNHVATTGTNANPILKRTGLTGFSDFVPAKQGTPLPIQLLFFEAECNDNQILVNWASVTEINNDFYTIEISSDLIEWEMASVYQGAGNSNILMSYSITLPKEDNLKYLRLKQTDFDGKYEYFAPISIANCNENFCDSKILENPVKDVLNLKYCSLSQDDVSIVIYDMNGVNVSNLKLNVEKGSNLLKINIGNLSNGFYILDVRNSWNQVFVEKFVIIK